MGIFELVDVGTKREMVRLWKAMKQEDRDYFADQVALALSVWGSDEQGRTLVAKVLATLVKDKSENLADFGLYIEDYLEGNSKESRKEQMEKASGVITRYRLKNALTSVPHKETEI